MMRHLIATYLLLSLSGCTYLTTIGGNLDEQLNLWEKEQEYGKALQALSYVKAEHPDYRRLMEQRKAILLKVRTYEQQTINQANEHVRQGNWAAALDLYGIALNKVPDSKPLQSALINLKRLQSNRLVALETELLVARGTGLLEQLPVHARLAEVNPHSWGTQRQLANARSEAEDIAAELTRRGATALEAKDIATAQKTLPLALRLNPDAATKRANQELLLHLPPSNTTAAKQAIPKQPAPALAQNDASQVLLQQYRQAYNRKDWLEARRLVAVLALQPTQPSEMERIRTELNTAVASAVRDNLDKGVALYSHGEYEKALALWQQAQQLEPDNQRVNAHIGRVERVLQKLHDLQAKNTPD